MSQWVHVPHSWWACSRLAFTQHGDRSPHCLQHLLTLLVMTRSRHRVSIRLMGCPVFVHLKEEMMLEVLERENGFQPLQPEQQVCPVGLSLFKEWCNQAVDYLCLSMVMSPSTYLCLWKSSQNLLTCDHSSGTPFSQLKRITCFFHILTFTAITFCTFLFLILQRERWNGVQARKDEI